MRMIALILGWHFSVIGAVTLLLASMVQSVSGLIIAALFLGTGLIMSFRFRDACATYRSDPPKEGDPERELEYY